MKKILISLIFVSCFACNKKDFSAKENPEVADPVEVDTVTPAIIALMQGSYESCRGSTIYPGSFNKIVIDVTGSQMLIQYELSASPICATKYYRHTYDYEISKAAFKTGGDSETILVDVKNKSTKIRWNLAWYVGQNFCGLNDWVLDVDREMTGLACLDLLSTYDAFHSSYPALDELIYYEMKVKASSLVFPIGTDNSGDDATDRLVTHPFEADEVP